METPIAAPTARPRGTAEATCTHGGCDARHYARGYCRVHYSRHRFGGDMDAPIRPRLPRGVTAPCLVEGCSSVGRARGLCSGHYMKQYVRPTFCALDLCEEREHARGYCQPHYNVLKSFNMDPADWEALYADQAGACAICRSPMTRAKAHTDHDHACCPRAGRSCGRCVRGLLCYACNAGLGFFRDNTRTLASALRYLR